MSATSLTASSPILRALLLLSLLLAAACERGPARDRAGEGVVMAPDPDATQAEPLRPQPRYGTIPVTAGFAGSSLRGVAGGSRDWGTAGGDCMGYGDLRPSHALDVKASTDLDLQVRSVEHPAARFGIVLLGEDDRDVRRCLGPLDIHAPGARLEAGPGVHRFVVTVDREEAALPYELEVVRADGPPPEAARERALPALERGGPPPEPTEEGTWGGLRVGAGNAPGRLNGRAGGTRRALTLGPECVGWIAEVPDHIIEVSDDVTLWFQVRAEQDTTLAIRSPGERWACNDDADGFNPALRLRLSPGRHEVYVGTWEEAADPPYELRIGR